MRERTSAVVLAGGASRRFGRDKRAEAVDGRPLLRRAVDSAAAVAADVLVAVAPDRPVPEGLVLPSGVRSTTDAPGHHGPVAGIAAGLTDARHDVVLVVAGDHPWVSPATLTALTRALEAAATADVAVLVVDGRRQPLLAAYRRRALPTIRARLDAGDRRAVGLLDHLAVVEVADAPDAARTAHDVDTPADLEPRP